MFAERHWGRHPTSVGRRWSDADAKDVRRIVRERSRLDEAAPCLCGVRRPGVIAAPRLRLAAPRRPGVAAPRQHGMFALALQFNRIIRPVPYSRRCSLYIYALRFLNGHLSPVLSLPSPLYRSPLSLSRSLALSLSLSIYIYIILYIYISVRLWRRLVILKVALSYVIWLYHGMLGVRVRVKLLEKFMSISTYHCFM